MLFLPKLPKNTDLIIDDVLSKPLPKLKGEVGYAQNGDIQLWYEDLRPKGKEKGAILLVMGLGQDALTWSNYFYNRFLDEGYRVIKMDNRDTGLSTWVKKWDKKNPYDLSDLANDCLAVIDELNIEKINILGISLGGMIAQQFAIEHPLRLASLISIMSTGFGADRTLPKIKLFVFVKLYFSKFIYSLPRTERNMIKERLTAGYLLGGKTKFALDVEIAAQNVLYNNRHRKGLNPKSSIHQVAAIKKSGSRYEGLKNITAPSLIIHGKDDTLIPVEHSYKLETFLKNAETLYVDGMGHGMPRLFTNSITRKIIDFLDGNS